MSNTTGARMLAVNMYCVCRRVVVYTACVS